MKGYRDKYQQKIVEKCEKDPSYEVEANYYVINTLTKDGEYHDDGIIDYTLSTDGQVIESELYYYDEVEAELSEEDVSL